MPGQTRNAANAEMAQRLKQKGEEREVGRCPLCHKIVGIGRPSNPPMMPHVLKCNGGGRRKGC